MTKPSVASHWTVEKIFGIMLAPETSYRTHVYSEMPHSKAIRIKNIILREVDAMLKSNKQPHRTHEAL